MPGGAAWVRLVGDGQVVEWACRVTDIVLFFDKNDDTCSIYDGLDATSGKLFLTVVGDADETIHLSFADGANFQNGIYVDQSRASGAVTICFHQVR